MFFAPSPFVIKNSFILSEFRVRSDHIQSHTTPTLSRSTPSLCVVFFACIFILVFLDRDYFCVALGVKTHFVYQAILKLT